eukprot:261512-Pleurochrysis_carterae.AAC.2
MRGKSRDKEQCVARQMHMSARATLAAHDLRGGPMLSTCSNEAGSGTLPANMAPRATRGDVVGIANQAREMRLQETLRLRWTPLYS